MSRFLFVVPPLTGHINPTVTLGAELTARGHEVAWVGSSFVLGKLLSKSSRHFSTDAAFSEKEMRSISEQGHGLRGAEAFRFLWRDFILPLGKAMLLEIERAIDIFRPDALIVDQQAVAGAVVARQRGLLWVTTATTSSDLVDPFETFPLFADWLQSELLAFQQQVGVPHKLAAAGDLRFSDHLVLAFSTPDLVCQGHAFPDEWVFVGPAFHERPSYASFPWQWLDPNRKHVLVTLGTVNASAGQTFFANAMAAAHLLQDQLQMILVAPDGLLGDTPPNVVIVPAVPQLQLLKHIDAVICHAGHNTVCETLAHGIPLIVAPIRDDQPIIAQQVTNAGAGIRLKFGRVKPEDFVNALSLILTDETYQAKARAIQKGFHAAGGAAKAVEALEKLTTDSTFRVAIAG